jgi:hypothetical protein
MKDVGFIVILVCSARLFAGKAKYRYLGAPERSFAWCGQPLHVD